MLSGQFRHSGGAWGQHWGRLGNVIVGWRGVKVGFGIGEIGEGTFGALGERQAGQTVAGALLREGCKWKVGVGEPKQRHNSRLL